MYLPLALFLLSAPTLLQNLHTAFSRIATLRTRLKFLFIAPPFRSSLSKESARAAVNGFIEGRFSISYNQACPRDPVIPVVPASSEFNSRLGLSKGPDWMGY